MLSLGSFEQRKLRKLSYSTKALKSIRSEKISQFKEKLEEMKLIDVKVKKCSVCPVNSDVNLKRQQEEPSIEVQDDISPILQHHLLKKISMAKIIQEITKKD